MVHCDLNCSFSANLWSIASCSHSLFLVLLLLCLMLFAVKCNLESSAEFADTFIKTATQCSLDKFIHEINADQRDKSCHADQLVNLVAFVVEAVNLHSEVLIDKVRCELQNATLFHCSKNLLFVAE